MIGAEHDLAAHIENLENRVVALLVDLDEPGVAGGDWDLRGHRGQPLEFQGANGGGRETEGLVTGRRLRDPHKYRAEQEADRREPKTCATAHRAHLPDRKSVGEGKRVE